MNALGRFINYMLERDQSKWYALSKADFLLLVISGIAYLATGESCVVLWTLIFGLNIVTSWIHNANKEEDNE